MLFHPELPSGLRCHIDDTALYVWAAVPDLYNCGLSVLEGFHVCRRPEWQRFARSRVRFGFERRTVGRRFPLEFATVDRRLAEVFLARMPSVRLPMRLESSSAVACC